jgi:hypothetical protein
MITVSKRRSDIVKLIQASKLEAAQRNKKIETIDLILKTGKKMYPLLPSDELYEICSTALRMILNEPESQIQQTTLLVHL